MSSEIIERFFVIIFPSVSLLNKRNRCFQILKCSRYASLGWFLTNLRYDAKPTGSYCKTESERDSFLVYPNHLYMPTPPTAYWQNTECTGSTSRVLFFVGKQ
jgi:hypothetical protein